MPSATLTYSVLELEALVRADVAAIDAPVVRLHRDVYGVPVGEGGDLSPP